MLLEQGYADPIVQNPEQPQRRGTESLYRLLKKITDVDNELIEFDPTEIERALGDSREKVDSYKFLIDRLTMMAKECAERVKEFQATAKSCKSKAEALERQLMYSMKANDFEKFTGNKWQAEIKLVPSVETNFSQPADHHRIHYPDFVRVKYEWDLISIRTALRPLPEGAPQDDLDKHMGAMELASIKFNPHVKFSPKKEI